MSGLFIFLVIFLAVVCMVLAISKFNQHPFIVLTVIAIAVGLVCGIPTEEVINTVKSGFGNILASIGIVILAGTIIGTILEKTGAALTMANTILKMVGKKNSVLTMAITGYVTGIPVFCDSGFVILSPISRALASQSNVSPGRYGHCPVRRFICNPLSGSSHSRPHCHGRYPGSRSGADHTGRTSGIHTSHPVGAHLCQEGIQQNRYSRQP